MKILFDLLYQVFLFLGINLIIMISVRIFGKSGNEWFIGAFVLGAFELVNPIIGIFSEKWWVYTALSVLAFVLLFVLIIFSGALISKKSMDDFGENAMLYLLVMYYPFVILVCGIIRFFMNLGKN